MPVPQRLFKFEASGLKFGIVRKQWVNVWIFLEPQAVFVCSSDFRGESAELLRNIKGAELLDIMNSFVPSSVVVL